MSAERYWEGRWRDEAAEVERLRAVIAEKGQWSAEWHGRFLEANAEATRLRSALECWKGRAMAYQAEIERLDAKLAVGVANLAVAKANLANEREINERLRGELLAERKGVKHGSAAL